jgi:hypothetical protein
VKQNHWNRLLKAARQAPTEAPAEMPLGFDTRVIAEWRAGREHGELLPWAVLLRGALACSALIMVVSLLMNYQALRDREPGPMAIADAAIQVSLLP